LLQTANIAGVAIGGFTFDADDRLSTETYDNNGNALTTGVKTFACDFANRLKSMNSGAVALQYDGAGNRVAKTASGVTTRYLVDDLNPTGYAQVVEEIVGSKVSRTYTYGTQRISENQVMGGVWTPSFYGYDGGGTVRFLTNAAAVVTDTYDYDAWGNVVNSTGSTPNVYLYQSEQWDPDLGLYYQRARYFNPLSGRFLSRDIYEGDTNSPSSFQKYLYAGADPVDRIDPTGHDDILEATEQAATAAEVGNIIGPRQVAEGLIQVGGISQAIICVWEAATGWLNIGNTVASGSGVGQVFRPGCGVAARPAPSPQPCRDNIGNCAPWRDRNRQPGDREITYQTKNPAPTCPSNIGERIFVTALGGEFTVNGFHTGLLKDGIVRDNIYPGGIPQQEWEDGAYTVPAACGTFGIRDVSFRQAVILGIGEIEIK
jgi:RHS repeat-associated protein